MHVHDTGTGFSAAIAQTLCIPPQPPVAEMPSRDVGQRKPPDWHAVDERALFAAPDGVECRSLLKGDDLSPITRANESSRQLVDMRGDAANVGKVIAADQCHAQHGFREPPSSLPSNR